MNSERTNIWWGPPKKFTTTITERKISWLELFYDLVYVIAISRTTHYLASHPSISSIGNYFYLFTIIFWGWGNGSLYHDLHGTPGIRTRFMTLWQMVTVAALCVALGSPNETLLFRTTICFAVMQLFITYLWWSVGIYDKNHRRLNIPYTVCFLLSFALLVISLYIPEPYKTILLWIIIPLNYLPPFLLNRKLVHRNTDLNLSASMVERMGLLTIIVFGETILGVINGVDSFKELNAYIWICFGLGILIVFALWWIYFALVGDRECKPGFLTGQLFMFLYIPTLGSLGMVGATFSVVLGGIGKPGDHNTELGGLIFTTGLGVFMLSVLGLTRMLRYTEDYDRLRRKYEKLLFACGILLIALAAVFNKISLIYLLTIIFIILLVVVVMMTRTWFKVELQQKLNKEQVNEQS
ncbi:MAG: low temperature requirement protein A [Ferruginibacter sp.]